VDVRVMGEPGSPPLETDDPDLLAWTEREGRILVTRNRRTIPAHFAAILNAGGHVAGILMVGEDLAVARVVEDLLLIWSASEAEEWRIGWLISPSCRGSLRTLERPGPGQREPSGM